MDNSFTLLLDEQKITNSSMEKVRELLISVDSKSAITNNILNSIADLMRTAFSLDGRKSGGDAQNPVLGQAKEDQFENIKRQDRMITLLEEIRDKLSGKPVVKEEDTKTDFAESSGIGKLFLALGVAVGAVIGLIGAQLKTIKFFLGGAFSKLLVLAKKELDIIRFIFSEKFAQIGKVAGRYLTGIRNLFSEKLMAIRVGIRMIFDSFVSKLKVLSNNKYIGPILTRLTTAIRSIFQPIINFTKALKTEGTIARVMTGIGNGITKMRTFFTSIGSKFSKVLGFFKKTEDGVSAFSKIFPKISGFFGSIGKAFSGFGKAFGLVANFVKRIAYPILIIMTIWDTVKGTIAGFEKGGIIGAIGGAIKGFFNSLITAPLDMLKGAVSWILNLFGMKNASKWLDSFSFTDIFNGFVDSITGMLSSVVDYFTSAWQEGGLLGVIGAALKGIIKTLVMMPADILKSGVSWILEKFGFENASKWLDSFSFSDLFDKMITGISDMLGSIPEYLGKAWDWVKETISGVFTGMWGLFKEWIIDPIWGGLEYIGDLIKEYIYEPFKEVFDPVIEWFKKIKDKVLGFFENFGIPEIGFSVFGKKFTVGPWYPFKSDQPESNADESSSGVDRISGEGFKAERSASGEGVIQYQDPTTGEIITRMVSDDVYDKVKKNVESGIDGSSMVADVIAEEKAYDQLSWFDKMKVNFTDSKATDLLQEKNYGSSQTGNTLQAVSTDNDMRKLEMNKPKTTANVVTDARTLNTVNKNQNVTVRQNTRDNSSSLRRYNERSTDFAYPG